MTGSKSVNVWWTAAGFGMARSVNCQCVDCCVDCSVDCLVAV